MLLGFDFKKYASNIFILNSKALRIQHTFFKVRAGLMKLVKARASKKTFRKTACRSFVSTQSMQKSKSSGKLSGNASRKEGVVKDEDYEKLTSEKLKRQMRMKEAREKYSNSCRSTNVSVNKSRPSTTEKKRRTKPTMMKQPTITDTELQKVVCNAWVAAETEKQKKLKQSCKPKRAPLRSQNSINEEILVNKIVSKAWVVAEKEKTKEEHRKKHPKPPVLHSRESINEANVVNEIVQKAWIKVDKEVKEKSASKIPKIKKQPLRSQESINEERLVGQIVTAAWDKAEDLKKKTMKARKQAAMNRKKPKVHRMESIQEELEVKKIVNTAWNEVHHDENNGSTSRTPDK